MNKSIRKKPPVLAWMQPGNNRRRQILTVVLVPKQPGHPMGLVTQIMDQQAGKVYSLVKKAMEEEPAALNDLTSRLDKIGLLPHEAQFKGMNPWQQVQQIVDGNPELRTHLIPQMKGITELEEIPGARELLEELTMYQWLEALEQEVKGR